MGVCATMRQSGEPTVEEILESIKKVIARDNRAIADERGREASALRGEKDGSRADDTDDIPGLNAASMNALEGASIGPAGNPLFR